MAMLSNTVPDHSDGAPTALELRMRRKARVSAAMRYSLLCVVGLVMIYPLIWLIGASFKTNGEMFDPETVRPAELPAIDRSAKNGRPELSEFIIGFVGRLADDKGIGDLAAAWRVIRREFANSRLLLVGAWESAASVSSWRSFLTRVARV